MPMKMTTCGMAKCSLVCLLHSRGTTLECLIFYLSFLFFAENFIGEK